MDKVVRRGYVKWTDKDGVFHKELLSEHPDLMTDASPEEQLATEEARRLNGAAKEFLEARDAENDDDVADTLEALKDAPDDVLTASDLVAVIDDEGNEVILPASEANARVDSNDLNNMSTSDTLPPVESVVTAPKPWIKEPV